MSVVNTSVMIAVESNTMIFIIAFNRGVNSSNIAITRIISESIIVIKVNLLVNTSYFRAPGDIVTYIKWFSPDKPTLLKYFCVGDFLSF